MSVGGTGTGHKLQTRSFGQYVEAASSIGAIQMHPKRLPVVRNRHPVWLAADEHGWSNNTGLQDLSS